MYNYFETLKINLIESLELQIKNRINEIRELETELNQIKKSDWVENQINQIKTNEN